MLVRFNMVGVKFFIEINVLLMVLVCVVYFGQLMIKGVLMLFLVEKFLYYLKGKELICVQEGLVKMQEFFWFIFFRLLLKFLVIQFLVFIMLLMLFFLVLLFDMKMIRVLFICLSDVRCFMILLILVFNFLIIVVYIFMVWEDFVFLLVFKFF